MHIVLLRHGSRIDKPKQGKSPGQSRSRLVDESSSNWLSNFDPPLDSHEASIEMEHAFKRLQSNIKPNIGPKSIIIHSSPYNRCIQTSEMLLDKIKHSKPFQNVNDGKGPNIKLRVDQALSEWLTENYNVNYLPPNDDGYSMINNVNAYLNQPENSSMNNDILNDITRNQLKRVKDSTWSYNQLGHCGEYGESPQDFTKRCFNYTIYLLQYYYIKQDPERDKQTTVFIVSHGAVISTVLQILLGRPIFNEVPLCTPIYFKQSDKRRSIFKLMDYDFNLNNFLGAVSDQEFYRILESPIDMTKLDPDNLRSELTIGTTGYTTIIQSIPQKNSKRKSVKTRRRRNTINISEKEHDQNGGEDLVTLKQTRSSKQLYLLNKDTKNEKVIDLNKLHSYFGDSDSESGSETSSSDEETENVFRGRISSLSSFNEENKKKFLLNKSNFFSKPDMDKDPYSHFFIHNDNENNNNSNSNNDYNDRDKYDNSLKLFKRFGTNESLKDLVPKTLSGVYIRDDKNFNYNSSITDDELSDSNSSIDDSRENDILSFGGRTKLENLLTSDNKKESEDDILTTILDGTFSKKPLRSHKSMSKLDGTGSSQLNIPITKSFGVAGIEPTLISSSNKNLLIRQSQTNLNLTKSKEDLKRILFNTIESESDSEEGGGWFGGFSR